MGFLEYRIDKDTPIPLYYQIKKIILEEIEKGAVKPGEAIPTEMEFCELYGISRTTIRQAVSELVAEGRLYRKKSKGTFVAPPKIPQVQTDLSHMYTSYMQDVQNLSMIPAMKVISVEVVPADERVSAGLLIQEGEKVICVKRKQMADNLMTSYIESYLVYPLCDQALEQDKFDRFSMYQILSEKEETTIGQVVRRISAYSADGTDAKLLEVKKGTAISLVVNQGFSVKTARPIIYEFVKYIGDKNVLILDYRLDPQKY